MKKHKVVSIIAIVIGAALLLGCGAKTLAARQKNRELQSEFVQICRGKRLSKRRSAGNARFYSGVPLLVLMGDRRRGVGAEYGGRLPHGAAV